MSCGKSKIIIVDDHALFREGLKLLIEKENIGEVIAEAENGVVLLSILKTLKPDVVIMDIDMPVMNGLEATEHIVKEYPDINVLVLSMHGDQDHYHKLINLGAKGYVLKTAGKLELENAISSVAQGVCYFSSELLRKIIIDLDNQKVGELVKNAKLDLTDREIEVLELLCKGLSVSEIANKLFLSVKTIEAHRSKLILKTETKNTIGLILFAIKNKIVSI